MKTDRDTLKELSIQQKIFFDNVTHELKTPLTTIVGYSELLINNGFTDEEFFSKATSRIISEGERLNRMVVDLLELSRSTSNNFSYEFKIIDLSLLVKRTCEDMFLKSKRYNMEISFSLEDNLIIYGDEDKMKEVLINLIDNSIKYGEVNSIIQVTCYKENDSIILKVQDEGEGIGENDLKNIFEPFYRVSKKKSVEKGSSGLGLNIVKAIIEKHKGSIVIDSVLNIGTEVTITLPLTTETFKEI